MLRAIVLTVALSYKALAYKENNEDIVSPGFGAKRLKKQFQSKLTGLGSTCDNVKEYRFKGAVKDNFAPIDKQENW